jgi:predicted CoA-substrate-specific enzyme activase
MYCAGIDAGSSAVKTVIVDPAGSIVSAAIASNRGDYASAIDCSLEAALAKKRIKIPDLEAIVSTGWGRKNVSCAGSAVTEITCHARGAFHLSPKTRTVIDIGGQDSKVIKVGRSGTITDFIMNNQCAAGTGAFLEFMAQTLGVGIGFLDAIGEKGKTGSVSINAHCTVFAQTEVVSLISQKHSKENIVKGILDAAAGKVASMANHAGIEEEIMLSGGVALNNVFVDLLAKKLKCKVIVPENPQIVGALGAALLAAEVFTHAQVS